MEKSSRGKKARAVIAALLLSALAGAASGQYPVRPVRFIVPSAAGGGTDIIARAISLKLAESLGQPFVVENRPGAGQMIGIELVAKSPADGYTILMAASTLAINPIMYKKVPYDPLRDFAPITQAATLANVIVVHPSLPVKSIAELIAYAKQRPGQLNFASAGIGTSPQMSIELLKSMAGIDMVHIPYKGTAPGVVDLLAGQVLVMAPNLLTALPHIKAGKLRALAVTSIRRSEGLPDVPTVAESGLAGYDSTQWYGVLAPAGTPKEIVARLHEAIVHALRDPEVGKRLAADGAEAVGSGPEEFAAFIKSETEKWARVATAAGIKPE
ncbi:MAG TPA: tripartite tricarboxylate transporter substrate binding protein [Burkholderiales bacterium]|jgi:tripartite-type tricarboxylate transporter receptor subunit TctC|nr:tripartite tricarboxylate transporter substrate binding protein [Burkholderiales bacterium]